MEGVDIEFSGVLSPFLSIVVILSALLLVAWGYWGFLRDRRERFAYVWVTFRFAAVALAALLFLRPVLLVSRFDLDDSRVAVLVDTSKSMGIRDAGDNRTRLQAAGEILLDPERGLLKALHKNFQVDLQAFGRDVRPLAEDDLESMQALDEATDLGGALKKIVGSWEGGPLDALVVLTDGRDNTSPEFTSVPGDSDVPVHVVGLGLTPSSPLTLVDGAVTGIECDGKVLTGDVLEIAAVTRIKGWDGENPVEAELLVDNKKVISQPPSLPFLWKAAAPGIHEIKVRLESLPNEIFLENNVRTCAVEVSSKIIEVLVYESRPRWEYKFIRRSLMGDKNLNVSCLIRTGANQYLQQGDSPVDLTSGMPGTMDQLARFDVLLLGDVGREDFDPGVLELLRQYVDEGRGGLIIAAGSRVLGPEGLMGTPLEAALPLGLSSRPRTLQGDFLLRITAEGAVHPLLKGLMEESGNLDQGARLESLYTTGALKPGGQIVAACDTGSSGALPLLAIHQYGTGKTAIVLSDSTWKWAMGALEGEEGIGLHPLFWGRMVRWASGREGREPVMDGESRLVLGRRHLAPGEKTTLFVQGVDESLEGTMKDEEGASLPLHFKPVEGGFESVVAPLKAGVHRLRVEGDEGALLGEAGIYVDRSFRETDMVTQDRDRLALLARNTSGAYYTYADASGIPESVLRKKVSALKRKEVQITQTPWIFAALVGFLALEWFLRRRAGFI